MSAVKIHGAPMPEPPKPVAKAVFKDQGSIPYPNPKTIKTPNADTVKIIKGKKRGMGAALRGGNFRIA
jgi:hypothetical protein